MINQHQVRLMMRKVAQFISHKCEDCDFARCLCDSEPETCDGPFVPYAGGPGARMNRATTIEECLATKAQP